MMPLINIPFYVIVFGQSAALSGMNAQLGRELRMGIRAAFRMINSEPSPGIALNIISMI